MTISSETCTITDSGDDSNTSFAYNFLIPYQADGVTPAVSAFATISGTDTPLVLDTDYSITGTGDPSGGTVEYPLSGSPLATGDTITITRDEAYVQPFAFPNQGFRPDQLEEALDWVVMQTQQLKNYCDLLQAQVDALEALVV